MMVATLALLWMGASAQPMMRPQGPLNEFSAIEGTSALQYNLPKERNIESRAGFGPAFYIFPDQKLDNVSALALAKELKVIEMAAENGGRISVVNPVGDKWQASDVQAFRELIGRGGPATNIKVVGIGNGATFVNQHLAASDLTGAIAGIVSIGGAPGKVCALPVPTYVGGKNAIKVAKPYQKTSDAAPKDPFSAKDERAQSMDQSKAVKPTAPPSEPTDPEIKKMSIASSVWRYNTYKEGQEAPLLMFHIAILGFGAIGVFFCLTKAKKSVNCIWVMATAILGTLGYFTNAGAQTGMAWWLHGGVSAFLLIPGIALTVFWIKDLINWFTKVEA